MDTKQKVFLQILVGVVVGVIVSSINGIQGTCQPFGWDCRVLGLLEFVLIMYLLFYGFPFVYKNYKTLKKTTDNKNIILSRASTSDSNLYLRLCNNEKRMPRLWVSQIQVGNKARWILTLMKKHPAKLFSLGKKECQSFPFIVWSKTYKYFSVADPNGEAPSERDMEMFQFGEYEFDVWVTFGFTKSGNDFANKYVVPVLFDEEHGLQIGEIKLIS